jgi:hypothetical protein
MSGAIRIQWRQAAIHVAIFEAETDRVHETPDTRKEEFRITDDGVDLEGREPEAL